MIETVRWQFNQTFWVFCQYFGNICTKKLLRLFMTSFIYCCRSKILWRRSEYIKTLCKCYKNTMQLKFWDIKVQECYKHDAILEVDQPSTTSLLINIFLQYISPFSLWSKLWLLVEYTNNPYYAIVAYSSVIIIQVVI